MYLKSMYFSILYLLENVIHCGIYKNRKASTTSWIIRERGHSFRLILQVENTQNLFYEKELSSVCVSKVITLNSFLEQTTQAL